MKAVRIPTIALAALALLPATASAASVSITGDDGNPVALNPTAATALRQLDLQYHVAFGPADKKYQKTTVIGPDGLPASQGSNCYESAVIPNIDRYVDYRGNGNYAVVVTTATNDLCTAGVTETKFLFSINAGTAITPPAGKLMMREKNSFSFITHQLPVSLNPGGIAYEVKYARNGVIGADGGISGPAADSFVDRNTGLADFRFTAPGTYVAVARIKSGDFYTPWSPAVKMTVKAPFDISSIIFTDPKGPSYKIRATLRDNSARGKRVTVYYAKGRKGGKYHKLGRTSKISSKGRFTLRFTLRRPGSYRLQYRFKGSSLVTKGKVIDGIKITRRFI
jgi:hypothetical protein